MLLEPRDGGLERSKPPILSIQLSLLGVQLGLQAQNNLDKTSVPWFSWLAMLNHWPQFRHNCTGERLLDSLTGWRGRKGTLTVPKDEARRVIRKLIKQTEDLRNVRPDLGWTDAAKSIRSGFYKEKLLPWIEETVFELRRLFTTEIYANKIIRAHSTYYYYRIREATSDSDWAKFYQHMVKMSYLLRSIRDDIDRIPEDDSRKVAQPMIQPLEPVTQAPQLQAQAMDSKRVFVVHGHDNEAKQTIARFLEKLGLEAIILHEQSDLGQTIIEKIERNSNVGFAVVVITPDDVGASKADHAAHGHTPLRGRARQNVIFELGYFMAKLGRGRVRALIKGDVDILSDIQGVTYISIDPNEAWRFRLAKEMKDSGLDIDLIKTFP